MTEKLLTCDQVAELLGCSTRLVFKLVKSGELPRPIKIGTNSRWRERTISEWIIEAEKAV